MPKIHTQVATHLLLMLIVIFTIFLSTVEYRKIEYDNTLLPILLLALIAHRLQIISIDHVLLFVHRLQIQKLKACPVIELMVDTMHFQPTHSHDT